nr:hypothetical protein [Nakamurella flavida]
MVCTANLCRSPMGERLLRAAVTRPGGAPAWEITSGGVQGFDALPMHAMAAQTLQERGIDVDGFASRPLSREMLEESDLVLTATRAHRAAAVQLAPRTIKRTFTLFQFARLAAAVPPMGPMSPERAGRSLVAEALLARSDVPAATGDEDDLKDPIGLPIEAFRRCADEIATAVAAIVLPVGLGPARVVHD